jgi:hypothetical protein
MYHCFDINEDIKVGDGNYIKATKMGEKHVLIRQPGGVLKGYVIYNCKYVPKLWINLFSITSALRCGWNNKGYIMSINKYNHTSVFDQVLPTSSGAITGVIMQLNVSPHAHVGVDVRSQELGCYLWITVLHFFRKTINVIRKYTITYGVKP